MSKPKPVSALTDVQRLWFYATANCDFGQCVAAAKMALALAENETNAPAVQAFSESAVVRYARPFSRCVVPHFGQLEAAQLPQLSTKLLTDFLPTIPGAPSIHHGAMEARDQYFAHSDIANKPFRLTKEPAAEGHWKWTIGSKISSLGAANLKNLMRLAKALEFKCALEVAELANRLLPEMKVGQYATIVDRSWFASTDHDLGK